ncbi:MAG: hypothetical protein R2706_15025 [Acidimicrobiales bacterium]
MSIPGPWRAAELTAHLTRVGADPDLNDDDWPVVDVPGHWAASADFADADGPCCIGRTFPTALPLTMNGCGCVSKA